MILYVQIMCAHVGGGVSTCVYVCVLILYMHVCTCLREARACANVYWGYHVCVCVCV